MKDLKTKSGWGDGITSAVGGGSYNIGYGDG